MQISLAFQEFYPHSPNAVWAALTDSKVLAAWLMPNDFTAEVGKSFTFKEAPALGSNWRGWADCSVVELDEPNKLVLSWDGTGSSKTTVTFELKAEGQGTRVSLHHNGETTNADAAELKETWRHKLGNLQGWLRGHRS